MLAINLASDLRALGAALGFAAHISVTTFTTLRALARNPHCCSQVEALDVGLPFLVELYYCLLCIACAHWGRGDDWNLDQIRGWKVPFVSASCAIAFERVFLA